MPATRQGGRQTEQTTKTISRRISRWEQDWQREVVARAERKLETPAIIVHWARGARGGGGSAPPGTIIRRRGTLKYPGVPQRQEVTGYAPEICATTATLFAQNAYAPFSLSSLPLFRSSSLLLHSSSFFPPLPAYCTQGPFPTERTRGGLLHFFRRQPKESRTRFHVYAHRKQLNRRLNGPSIEDIGDPITPGNVEFKFKGAPLGDRFFESFPLLRDFSLLIEPRSRRRRRGGGVRLPSFLVCFFQGNSGRARVWKAGQEN